jgi:copper chaperone
MFNERTDGVLMSEIEPQSYSVVGMSCAHCAAAVNEKVSAVAGVSDVDVDVDRGVVLVRGSGVDDEAVRVAVEAAGYGLADHA